MADYDPVRRDENTFENPFFDVQEDTGESYDPAEAWKFRDETNLQLETQFVKMALTISIILKKNV